MVSLNLTVQGLSSMAGGLLLLLLGLAIASLRPRRRENVALALFTGCFGLGFFVANILARDEPPIDAIFLLAGASWLVASAAVLWVVRRVPRPLAGSERRLLVVWGAVLVAFAVPAALAGPFAPDADPALGARAAATLLVLIGALFGSLYLLALRFQALSDPVARGQLGLMSAALATYPGFVVGAGIVNALVPWSNPEGTIIFACGLTLLVGLAALWLRHASRAEDPRMPRNVALLMLVLPCLGLVHAALHLTFGQGLSRVAGVAVIAYAILRHQLLGLDLKVRWTIKNSTVAAAFIGVFFVVSNAAQQFFESSLGAYAGILAAGGLVFVMAPLQRLAERIAEKAVPVAAPGVAFPGGAPGATGGSQRDEAYRAAVRYALADRIVTRAEERHLADLAAQLGIDASHALTLREQAEAELLTASSARPRALKRSTKLQ